MPMLNDNLTLESVQLNQMDPKGSALNLRSIRGPFGKQPFQKLAGDYLSDLGLP